VGRIPTLANKKSPPVSLMSSSTQTCLPRPSPDSTVRAVEARDDRVIDQQKRRLVGVGSKDQNGFGANLNPITVFG